MNLGKVEKLVYIRLPDGWFETRAVYSLCRGAFEDVYPDNKHPEAKIRQTLQKLRDKKYLKHDKKGRWRRL